MKKSMLLIGMCMLISICYAQENKVSTQESRQPVAQAETIVFDETELDFGVVSRSGGLVEGEFTFTNKGNKPLVITKVSPGCGCTVADYPKEAIAPGKKGVIKASFNPNGTKAGFNKPITVLSNGNPSRIVLHIKGEVK